MILNQVAQGGSPAISVVDTPDSGGGTVRTITASGSTIPTPASDISKLILNGVTQMDVTDTTATVSDVASGKVFTQVDGVKGTGTASGGGSISVDGIAMNTEPSGAIVLMTATAIQANAFRDKANITAITSTSVTSVASESMRQCKNLASVSLPNLTSQIPAYAFTDCQNLAVGDYGKATQINNNSHGNCAALRTIILRRTSLCALQGWNANALGGIYNNPSSSTIYVPQALISSYQTASNWSSAYAAGLTFAKIEGSIYE